MPKISELPADASAGGSEQVAVNDAGTTKRLTTQQIADAFLLTDRTANTVLAGPTTGAAADPTFRALVTDDLPNLGVTTGKIAASAVETAKIADLNVTTGKLANDAVTADKLADTAVSPGSYTSANITVDQQGRLTAAANGSPLGGAIAFSGVIRPSQITAQTNNYNPTGLSTASVIGMSSDAERSLTGLQGGSEGRFITIWNSGSSDILLRDEHTDSDAANRFTLSGTNGIRRLYPSAALSIIYDATASRWRLIEGPGLRWQQEITLYRSPQTAMSSTTASSYTVFGTGTTANYFQLPISDAAINRRIRLANWRLVWNPTVGSGTAGVELVHADSGPTNETQIAEFTSGTAGVRNDAVDITSSLNTLITAGSNKQIGHRGKGNGTTACVIYMSVVEITWEG